MNRLLPLAALFGLAMTGAAAAATAEVSVTPVNGTCPSGFDLSKSGSGADDLCIETADSSGSGSVSMAMSATGDDDHGNHDFSDNDHSDSDHSDHDSDRD